MIKVFTFLVASLWVAILLGFCLPLWAVGYSLRTVGTLICNLASVTQDGLESAGNRIAQRIQP